MMTDMDLHPSAYESYPGFLKATVQRFWEDPATPKSDALALLLSAREAWEVALDRATSGAGVKAVLTGAAGAATVTVLLRTVLGGPLGVVLGGASAASLAALYARHGGRVRQRTEAYRRLVTDYREEFETIREDYLADRLRRSQRDLMVEGLFARFQTALRRDQDPAGEPSTVDTEGEPDRSQDADRPD